MPFGIKILMPKGYSLLYFKNIGVILYQGSEINPLWNISRNIEGLNLHLYQLQHLIIGALVLIWKSRFVVDSVLSNFDGKYFCNWQKRKKIVCLRSPDCPCQKLPTLNFFTKISKKLLKNFLKISVSLGTKTSSIW